MPVNSRELQIATSRVLTGFALIVAAWIWLSIPEGPIVRRDFALKIDPNVAPRQVLEALPSLGPARVKAIIEAREFAPLRSVEDMDRRIKGIGPVTASGLKPFLRFDASKP